MNRSYKFEVSVEIKGKPQIDGIFAVESDALARAEYLLALAKYTAVRVFQVDARDNSKLIFEKAYSGGGRSVTLGEIDNASHCQTVWEVFGADSRGTLIRLLRKYFDEQVLIPAEVLHQYLMLRMLERDASLFIPALNRLSAVQAKRLMIRPEVRAEELSALFRNLLALAKESDSLAPYAARLAGDGLDALLAHLASAVPPEQHARIVSYAVARFLEDAREWTAKVTTLCRLFGKTPTPPSVDTLDELLAETIDGTAPIRGLIGYSPDLASALTALALVSTGRLDDRSPGTPALFELSRAISLHSLPRTQGVLLSVICRSLDGTAPLTRTGSEGEALRRLLPLIREYGGFRGRGPMCAAVTRRAKTAFSPAKDDLPLETAVDQVMINLPVAADRVGFLLDLLTTDIGTRKATWLTQKLGELFANIQSLQEFLPGPEDSLAIGAIIEHFRPRLFGGGIPHDLAGRFLRRLELMVMAQERAGGLPVAKVLRQSKGPVETTIDLSGRASVEPQAAHLVFTYQGEDFFCGLDRMTFVMGRNPDCDLIVTFGGASRAHAKVFHDQDNFVLLDQSKNGTYVKLKDQAARVLKGESLVLDRCGTLFLGADPSIDSEDQSHSISFRYVPAGG